MIDRHAVLEKENIKKLVLKYSVPAIAGMAVNALYNLVDRIFVGQGVGTDALSGIAVTLPFTLTLLGFAVLIAVGTAVRVSIKIGEKKPGEAERIIGNGFTSSLIIGAVLTIACLIFMRPLLIMFGGSDVSLFFAEQYMGVLIFGTTLQMIGLTLNNSIRAEGNPIMALVTMLAGAIINTALDPLFIFVLHLGVGGSALATLIAQAGTALWTMWYFLNPKSLIRLKLKNLNLSFPYCATSSQSAWDRLSCRREPPSC